MICTNIEIHPFFKSVGVHLNKKLFLLFPDEVKLYIRMSILKNIWLLISKTLKWANKRKEITMYRTRTDWEVVSLRLLLLHEHRHTGNGVNGSSVHCLQLVMVPLLFTVKLVFHTYGVWLFLWKHSTFWKVPTFQFPILYFKFLFFFFFFKLLRIPELTWKQCFWWIGLKTGPLLLLSFYLTRG